MDLHGKCATVMGLGHFGGGAAAARWLARQGAIVTVTDLAEEQSLSDALATLAGLPIAAVHLGGHREDDFRLADLVVVNPAVRPGNRFVQIAIESGARLTTEIELLMEACPAPIIGVTGSNGKSTTAAMTAAILQADGRRVWLGGNLGGSLLERLDEITAADWVVLELSSFQLHYLGPGTRMPRVAMVTGCAPNHLDWHPSYAHYVAAKQRILTGQTADDLALLNTGDAEVASWRHLARGRLLPRLPWDEIPPLGVPGAHNRINASLAGGAAAGIGCAEAAIRQGLQSFRPLPQRLEMFAVVDGRRFYNDSAATTPESTLAALEAVAEPLWLLAGGSDKGADFHALAAAIAERARGAAFYGGMAETLRRLVLACRPAFLCTSTPLLADALSWCWQRSRPGDSIVLSPACASHDQFTNFRHRGETFAALVREMAAARPRGCNPPGLRKQ